MQGNKFNRKDHMTKLWLDDVRPAPDDSWSWAKTVEEAQEILLTGEVTVASLDHDLGAIFDPDWEPGGDGIDLAIWMVEEQIFPDESLTIHSWNPSGALNMKRTLESGGCTIPCELKPFEIPQELYESRKPQTSGSS